MIAKNIFKFNKINSGQALLFLLIASLPLFPFRSLTNDISITFILLTMTCVFAIFSLLKKKSIPNVFNKIDFALFIYLSVLLVFVPLSHEETAYLVVGKTCFYFSCYLSLKITIFNLSTKVLERTVFYGVIFGSLSLILLSSIAVAKFSFNKNLLVNINYWDFTFNIFKSINVLFGNENVHELRGSDLMRTSMGETVAFYFIVSLCSVVHKNRIGKWLLVTLNAALVMLLFSRRSLLAMVLTTAAYACKNLNRNPVLFFGLIIVFTSVITYLSLTFLKDTHIFDITVTERFSQYETLLSIPGHEVITGKGVGAKLESGAYVHNFVASNFYMLGLIGAIVGAMIPIVVLFEYVKSLRIVNPNPVYYAMLIPILSLLVGSTTEGVFSPACWIVLGLFGVFRKKEKQIKLNPNPS
jgi:hypothetical protein